MFFRKQVAPIFEQHCLRCHGKKSQRGGLSLATAADLLAGGDSGPVVAADKPSESLLLSVVSGDKPKMPKKAPPLTARQVSILKKWIAEGANWPKDVVLQDRKKQKETWWSLQPLVRPPIPIVKTPGWVRTPLDAFILRRLEQQGMKPSPEADRRTLIRRLSFDLLGLPPTPAEIDAFVHDRSAERLRETGRSSARLAALRRALGAALARCRPLRRHARLRQGQGRGRTPGPIAITSSAPSTRTSPIRRFVQEQIAGDVLLSRHARRHRRPRFPRGRSVGLRRPRRTARGHARQEDHAQSRPRRHGRHGDEHVHQPDGAVRPLSRSQVRSDHAGGLLQSASGVRRRGPRRSALRSRRRGGASTHRAAKTLSRVDRSSTWVGDTLAKTGWTRPPQNRSPNRGCSPE